MKQQNSPFEKYVFVCTKNRDNGKACCHEQGEQLTIKLKQKIKDLGLHSQIRVTRSGCLDVCSFGANVLVMPENTWYYTVSQEDIDELCDNIIGSKSQ